MAYGRGLLLGVGSLGRFMTLGLLDRITNIGNALSSNLDKMTEQERKRYRHFLKTELRKVDQQQTQESNDINKNGGSSPIKQELIIVV